jgi:hypothetical protein
MSYAYQISAYYIDNIKPKEAAPETLEKYIEKSKVKFCV